jgi:hypothetical protein
MHIEVSRRKEGTRIVPQEASRVNRRREESVSKSAKWNINRDKKQYVTSQLSNKMDQFLVPLSNWVSVASSVTKSNALQASETQKNQAIVNQLYFVVRSISNNSAERSVEDEESHRRKYEQYYIIGFRF